MNQLVAALLLLASVTSLLAPRPMITGDVPTADKGRFELYAGLRYQENEAGVPARQLPFTELVYGISDRQELTFEIAYLSQRHEHGFGDAVVGTKYQFLKETETRPGIAGSFELKLPTGSETKGLGTGEFDYAASKPRKKTFGSLPSVRNTRSLSARSCFPKSITSLATNPARPIASPPTSASNKRS